MVKNHSVDFWFKKIKPNKWPFEDSPRAFEFLDILFVVLFENARFLGGFL